MSNRRSVSTRTVDIKLTHGKNLIVRVLDDESIVIILHDDHDIGVMSELSPVDASDLRWALFGYASPKPDAATRLTNVARAIYEKRAEQTGVATPFERMSPNDIYKKDCFALADAAIEAMDRA